MKTASHAIRGTRADRIFDVVLYAMLLFAVAIVALPLLQVLSSSFSSVAAVRGGHVWLWPVEPTLEAYRMILHYKKIWSGFGNSALYTVTGTLIGVVVTICGAYPLSRPDLRGKNLINTLFLITMLFGGGLIPTFLLIKNLGMLDTIWAIIIPGAVSVWNIIIMRTFFQTSIPAELIEAATIDGSSDLGTLLKIVLPLSGSIIAVISLFVAVGYWNSYFGPMIYLNTESKFPLTIYLRNILILNMMDPKMIQDLDTYVRQQGFGDLLKYALIVVSSAPLLIVYPLIQKHFVKGVMIGSLKG